VDLSPLLSFAADSVLWREALVSFLLAYALCQAIAAVYAWSYRGLSFSRQMVQSLVVGGLVAAMVMMAIGNSLARGIGIVGTLALVRFRTNLRDPLDMVFIFASMGAGIAAGTGSYATAVLGTTVFLVVVAVMRFTDFGARTRHDGLLRIRIPPSAVAEEAMRTALVAACRRFSLVTLREVKQGELVEHAYQVSLKEPGAESELIGTLNAIEGAKGVVLSMQEATVEL
jgi:uncharacterized membrane protein YhiD involved in acid resistance